MDIELLRDNLALTQREIAKKLGTSQTNIRYWLKKYGLSTGRPACPRPQRGNDTETDRQCTWCKEYKPFNQYYPKKGGKRHSRCNTCISAQTVERQRAFKAQCVVYKGGCCEVCGYDRYQGSFDFHHRDPEQKDFSIATVRLLSFNEAITAELDKCALLCANCHREVHGGIISL